MRCGPPVPGRAAAEAAVAEPLLNAARQLGEWIEPERICERFRQFVGAPSNPVGPEHGRLQMPKGREHLTKPGTRCAQVLAQSYPAHAELAAGRGHRIAGLGHITPLECR